MRIQLTYEANKPLKDGVDNWVIHKPIIPADRFEIVLKQLKSLDNIRNITYEQLPDLPHVVSQKEMSDFVNAVTDGAEVTPYGSQINAAFRLITQHALSNLPDSQIMEIPDLFPAYEFKTQSAWQVGEIFRYGVNKDGETQLYRVLQQIPQGQEHHTPDKLLQFFKPIGFSENGVPIWTQPLGAFDAYQKGDEVEHPEGSGNIWISDIDGNVWMPGVHGWVRK